ncbi:MAG: bifunctional diaminohydroxyphosphoribosylaminopyrimidine deaminase/5-amino-6-(5-phosphoribosylamino)uracil reductase RibD [Pyrinomonadaceae bacterium]|nr:bifunctional diaminohydroxyphosphoribosylaminopyrimidine deaminase/5-amino-6-(5-phosphoribosylamino)uracil reductase RibD [Pyrinomonadaceae bacterium]
MTERALELAALGVGQVSPGPLVGCVVVSAEGDVVGEGTYFYEGVTHAEVIALSEAGASAQNGTAYISLEPHSHHGKTPPCTEALIRAGIRRVVVPIEDPNPLVSGKGFELLCEEGIEVVTGIRKEEAECLNEKFIHWHRNGRPFVHLKIASSLDGKCATRTGDSKWITGKESREIGQTLRHDHDAILVGKRTIEKDDPSLTYRGGNTRRRPLQRIILDTDLSISPESKVVKTADETPTVIFCSSSVESERRQLFADFGVDVLEIDGGPRNLPAVMEALYSRDIQGVLVEGGPTVTGEFLDQGIADKLSIFVAPLVIGGTESLASVGGHGAGSLSEAWRLERVSVRQNGDDLEVTGYPVATRVKE